MLLKFRQDGLHKSQIIGRTGALRAADVPGTAACATDTLGINHDEMLLVGDVVHPGGPHDPLGGTTPAVKHQDDGSRPSHPHGVMQKIRSLDAADANYVLVRLQILSARRPAGESLKHRRHAKHRGKDPLPHPAAR